MAYIVTFLDVGVDCRAHINCGSGMIMMLTPSTLGTNRPDSRENAFSVHAER